MTKMPLLHLPNEILIEIIHYLGPKFFRHNLRRLTVCKHWYLIAQNELWAEVSFVTPRGIQYLADKLYERPSPVLPAWAPLAMRSLKLQLHGLKLCSVGESWSSIISNPSYGRLHRVMHEVGLREQFRPFTLLQELRRLRKLTVSIHVADDPQWEQTQIPACEHAPYSTMKIFSQLALPCLTKLDLSLLGAGTFTGQPHEPYGQHMCTAINRVLNNLNHLQEVHLTLGYVCPCLFKSGQSGCANALRTLVLNCNIKKYHKINRHTSDECYCCEDKRKYNPRDLVQVMRIQRHHKYRNQRMKAIGAAAKKFASALKSPKTFRIIWPNQLIDSAAVLCTRLGHPKLTRIRYAWDCLAEEAHAFVRGESCGGKGTLIDLDEDYERSKRTMKLLRDEYRLRCPEQAAHTSYLADCDDE